MVVEVIESRTVGEGLGFDGKKVGWSFIFSRIRGGGGGGG